eukprot:Skav215118  [mRNA]  locus=scaffold1893:348724:350109:- [translate_table: standard]
MAKIYAWLPDGEGAATARKVITSIRVAVFKSSAIVARVLPRCFNIETGVHEELTTLLGSAANARNNNLMKICFKNSSENFQDHLKSIEEALTWMDDLEKEVYSRSDDANNVSIYVLKKLEEYAGSKEADLLVDQLQKQEEKVANAAARVRDAIVKIDVVKGEIERIQVEAEVVDKHADSEEAIRNHIKKKAEEWQKEADQEAEAAARMPPDPWFLFWSSSRREKGFKEQKAAKLGNMAKEALTRSQALKLTAQQAAQEKGRLKQELGHAQGHLKELRHIQQSAKAYYQKVIAERTDMRQRSARMCERFNNMDLAGIARMRENIQTLAKLAHGSGEQQGSMFEGMRSALKDQQKLIRNLKNIVEVEDEHFVDLMPQLEPQIKRGLRTSKFVSISMETLKDALEKFEPRGDPTLQDYRPAEGQGSPASAQGGYSDGTHSQAAPPAAPAAPEPAPTYTFSPDDF